MTDLRALDGIKERARGNAWHRAWMERAENAYEWWYCDIVSADSAWHLVVIFLLGSPFSPYAHECAAGRRPDPLDHNAVFIALHRAGRLHYYAYARYPRRQITLSDDAPLDLKFGSSRWQSDFQCRHGMALDAENANRRRITAEIAFADTYGENSQSISLTEPGESAQHVWLPVVLAGTASVSIDLRAPAESAAPERVRFTGSAYHDHNWGCLPLDRAIHDWLWARADFGPMGAAVLYRTNLRSGGTRNLLVARDASGQLIVDKHVDVQTARWRRSAFGLVNPSEFVARRGADMLTWRLERPLDSTPFYLRCGATATLTTQGTRHRGVGMAELFKPRGIDSAFAAWAMRQRMYEPGL